MPSGWCRLFEYFARRGAFLAVIYAIVMVSVEYSAMGWNGGSNKVARRGQTFRKQLFCTYGGVRTRSLTGGWW